MFLNRNKKNNVYPCKPKFYFIKVGLSGSKLYRYVFMTKSSLNIRRYVSHIAAHEFVNAYKPYSNECTIFTAVLRLARRNTIY